MKEAFLTITPQKTESVLLFKAFISSALINSSRLKNNQKNVYDINPMSANHPLLIFANLIETSPRIAINYLYENTAKLSKDIYFPSYMPIALRKNAPRKKAPQKKNPKKIAPRKITPRKYLPRKIAPQKIAPRKSSS